MIRQIVSVAATRHLVSSILALSTLCAALLLASLAPAPAVFAAEKGADDALAGDPFRGRVLFETKRCVRCHSVWGHGGTLGTDIARAVSGKSILQLAGEFWNHTPRMIDETLTRGYPWPSLERDEMADLLSYLYYLQLFDAPGDASRGAYSFVRLGCHECHTLGEDAASPGGPLDGFSRFPSPVPLAQAMWNAGPAMQRSQVGLGNPIPEFTGPEIADIQAYIREQAKRPWGERDELLTLPDPARGSALFSEKGCAICHGAPDGAAADVGVASLGRSVAEIGGILWNHSYAMQASMRAQGVPFPRFKDSELADLISYLYMRGFLERAGDAARGKALFESRGCTACHAGGETVAANLKEQGVADPVTLTATMWNHAPEMHDLMAERGVAWPKFEDREMEDLAAYLSSLGPGTAEGR